MKYYPMMALAGVVMLTAACTSSKAPPAEVVQTGQPVSCVNLRQIRSTEVIDDQTVDFHMNGGQILRNTLSSRCPGLATERAFAYKTSISQLCSVDTITVVHSGGGPRRGATCGLGEFVPVERTQSGPQTPSSLPPQS